MKYGIVENKSFYKRGFVEWYRNFIKLLGNFEIFYIEFKMVKKYVIWNKNLERILYFKKIFFTCENIS